MKRILAFMLDVIFLAAVAVMSVVIFSLVIIEYMVANLGFGLMLEVWIWSSVLMWSYYFLSDYIGKGRTIGKKILGIRLVSTDNTISADKALKHASIKVLACFVYPLSFIYFICKNEMFYDKWLDLKIVEEDSRL